MVSLLETLLAVRLLTLLAFPVLVPALTTTGVYKSYTVLESTWQAGAEVRNGFRSFSGCSFACLRVNCSSFAMVSDGFCTFGSPGLALAIEVVPGLPGTVEMWTRLEPKLGKHIRTYKALDWKITG